MHTFNDAMTAVALGAIEFGRAARAKWAPDVFVTANGHLFKMQDGEDFVQAVCFFTVREFIWFVS